MARVTAAEREIARNQVTLYLLNRRGDVVEEHLMQSWDVRMKAGEIAGKFRDAHGYTPILRVRFGRGSLNPGREADYLLPDTWRNR
jgi:hypothetical protein